jgi:hypothetical protein
VHPEQSRVGVVGGGGEGPREEHDDDERFQELAGEPVPAGEPARDQRDEHEEHAGEGEVGEGAPDPTPFAERTSREGEGGGARQHADGRGDDIGPEADPRDAIGVVLEIERKDGNKAGEHDDAPAVLGHPSASGDARSRLHPPLDRAPDGVARNEESEVRPHGGGDPDVRSAPHGAEDHAPQDGHGQAGNEEHRGEDITHDEDDGGETAIALKPLLEPVGFRA